MKRETIFQAVGVIVIVISLIFAIVINSTKENLWGFYIIIPAEIIGLLIISWIQSHKNEPYY